MKFGRKLTATAAVVGLAAGLTLIGSSPVGAQSTNIQIDCRGVPGSTAEILIEAATADFPGGIVPIPATIVADVPGDLEPGASAGVNFSWELNPGSNLETLAVVVADIQTINAELLEVSVSQTGGTGGPYAFTPTAVLQLQPPSYPLVSASGQVTAGDDPISYAFNIGRLDLEIITPTVPEMLELICQVNGNNIIGGTSVGGVAPPTGGGESGGASGGGGAAGPSTTLRQGTTGASQSRVTG